MSWIILIFGLLWIFEGIVSLWWSEYCKNMITMTLPEAPVRSMGVFFGVIGLLIFYASKMCRFPYPVAMVGGAVFVQGITGMILPEAVIRRFILFVIRIPLWGYKIWGVCMLSVGFLFLYCR